MKSCNTNDKIWDYYQNQAPEVFALSLPRFDAIIKHLTRKAQSPTPVVLNIGVGSGYLETKMQQLGWRVYALDPDAKSIARLREQKIEAQQGYIENLPFDERMFDFVVASEVLEHLSAEQGRLGVAEIARVLKPNGWFIGTVPYNEDMLGNQAVCPKCGEVFHRWGHQRTFDLDTMAAELSPHFHHLELKRTAFVALRGRSLAGKLSGMMRKLLAWRGVQVAIPSIYFAGQVRSKA